MKTNTQSYEMYDSKMFRICKPLNELLEDAEGEDKEYDLEQDIKDLTIVFKFNPWSRTYTLTRPQEKK
jgi:uncharacterized protein YkuJ